MHNPKRTGAARVARLFAVLLALIDPLVAVFRAAMRATKYAPTLPRLIHFSTNPTHRRSHGKAVAGGRGFAVRFATGVALIALAFALPGGSGLFAAFGPTDVIADRQKEYDAIVDEAEKLQKKYEGKRWDAKDRERFETLCKEGDALLKDIEAEKKWTELQNRGRQIRDIPEPVLPNARNHHKGDSSPREIAGFISLGDAVVMSEAFQTFAKNGYARGQHAVVQIVSALNGKNVMNGPTGEPLVALTREQRKHFEEFLQTKEMKAVPTLGTGVIEPDRLARVPQTTVDERLTIRDVISTGQTGSSSVEYVRDISGAPALLDPTAHGAQKPEVTAEWELAASPVRTIAGWMPVQNQQLEDWAQLRSLIDGRLRYIVKRSEEHEIIYGIGTPPHLEGILTVTGTQDIAVNGRYNALNHTLIDVVKMGITDIMVAGYSANAVVMHPYDWEEIVLAKGTDERYVWAVVTDNNGSRIWGVRVVESIGAQNRSTGERNIVVGDWQMGAQLLDRMDLTVQVGLIDKQFIENMRTILAEERVALPIYAPAAFAYFETEAATS